LAIKEKGNVWTPDVREINMKTRRKMRHPKTFYIQQANAAHQLEAMIPCEDLLAIDPANRSAVQKHAAGMLRGTVFHDDRAEAAVDAFLLAHQYLRAFRAIMAARTQNREERIPIPFDAWPYEVVVRPSGKVRGAPPRLIWLWYREFLADLPHFNVDRLKQCPECETIFEGAKNKVCCGTLCLQQRWRRQNADAYKEAQQKSLEAKKEHRQSAKIAREQQAVAKIPDNVVSDHRRDPRQPRGPHAPTK
jgi:hypothetical protein